VYRLVDEVVVVVGVMVMGHGGSLNWCMDYYRLGFSFLVSGN
jgi:hypothetical protein